MLSQAARQEVLRRIESSSGLPVIEQDLTPQSRQAITNLATILHHLSAVAELLRGEEARLQGSALLRLAARLGKDSEKAERDKLAFEVNELQKELGIKLTEVAKQIGDELNAKRSGVPPPEYKGSLQAVELKCPRCGAPLPLPTGRTSQCQYCKATLTMTDMSQQIKSMIQSV